MGSLSRLSRKCAECLFVNTCNHKQMEAVACFSEPMVLPINQSFEVDITTPVLKDNIMRIIQEDIKKEIYKTIYLCSKK